MRSLISIAMWPRISSLRSLSSGRIPRSFALRPVQSPALLAWIHWGRIHDSPDGVDEPRPAVLLANQLLLACRGQLVILRPLVGLAHAPFRLQPAPLHQTMQRGIEGAGFDLEQIIRLRANRLTNAVAVLGFPLEGSENEHVKGPLEELQSLVVGVCRHSRRQSTTVDVECQRLAQVTVSWRSTTIVQLTPESVDRSPLLAASESCFAAPLERRETRRHQAPLK